MLGVVTAPCMTGHLPVIVLFLKLTSLEFAQIHENL
jgi:hypothetical protein